MWWQVVLILGMVAVNSDELNSTYVTELPSVTVVTKTEKSLKTTNSAPAVLVTLLLLLLDIWHSYT